MLHCIAASSGRWFWLLVLGCLASPAWAQEAAVVSAPAPAATPDAVFIANNIWMLLCTALVFIMHLGFATVESGLTRAKNTCNILYKNTLIPAIGLVTYAVIGFKLMYPGGGNGVFSFAGVWLTLDEGGLGPGYADGGYTYWTDFLFQGMFAATAATIVSGAVAERVKLLPFLIFSTVFVAISYPITGYWKWGSGWLYHETESGAYVIMGTALPGFIDFAGSTLVHSVGGWGALMGAIILGPRLGKYASDGAVNPIPGHNIPLATIGVFLLWLGWFGFNGGSVLSADPGAISLVLVTTCLAAAAGAIGASIASWLAHGKPDVTMALNGILAGLVGITAGADIMSPMEATVIGAISGVLVVCSVIFFDKLKIDDPVGAISVHLVCGVFGTLVCGVLGSEGIVRGENGVAQLISQVIGVAAVGGFTVIMAGALFVVLKAVMGIRVSEEEEVEGLDLGEHDMAAYPDFQRTYIKSYDAREM